MVKVNEQQQQLVQGGFCFKSTTYYGSAAKHTIYTIFGSNSHTDKYSYSYKPPGNNYTYYYYG